MSTDLAAPLASPEGIRDPYSVYRRLRETAPVYWSKTFNAWIVTGYHQVREVFRAHDRFSSVGKAARNVHLLPEEVRAQVPLVELSELRPALSSADPPVHERQKSLVVRPLSPRRLAAKRAWVEGLCADLCDAMARENEPELIRHFSFPLAYRCILGLFGAPLEHIPLYREATEARAAFIGSQDVAGRRGGHVEAAFRYERASIALRDALESLYPALRDHPDESVISSLLHPGDSAKELDADELFITLKGFIAAGPENIIYALPTAMHELLRHPEQLEMVRSDPSLGAAAYEEAVRFDTPNQFNLRIAAVDTELAGATIRAGDQVLNFKASANRDPSVWTDPDRFDITRDQNEPTGGSVSFGQGIHFCAGAGIARLEGPVGIATLVSRFPDLRLADDWVPTWPTPRKLAALPLSISPRISAVAAQRPP
jgi:cytochrome P450